LVSAVVGACGKVQQFPDGGTSIDSATTAVDASVDATVVECNAPNDCPSQICTNHACVNSQDVACRDNPPANATSVPGTVTITYTVGIGWSTPTSCAWNCDGGYCANGGACAVDLPDNQYDPGAVGSRWFGGDDRPNFHIRSLGDGQVFVLPQTTAIKALAFYFDRFASAQTAVQAAANVRYDLRDASGGLLSTALINVPATFPGGWLYWPIQTTLAGNTPYILDAYIPDVYAGDNITTGIRTDFNAQYAGGPAYGIETTDTSVDMSVWGNWGKDLASDYAWKVVTDDACPIQ
jgi:hypothetical protein